MATKYIDMTPDERRAAWTQTAEARLTIEGCRNPSPKAVRMCLREEAFILRVALSRGDAWAKAESA